MKPEFQKTVHITIWPKHHRVLYLCKYNATPTKIVSIAFDRNSTQISRITTQPNLKNLT